MRSLSAKLILTAFALSFTAACSKSSDDKPIVAPLNKIDMKSCVYTLNQGDTANFGALYTKEISKVYFGKEYNLALLKAVSTASVSSSLDFINRTSATVYKSAAVPTQKCTSDLFAGAKDMTSDVLTRWDDANAGIPEDSVILGLYLPKVKSATYPSLNDSAAIIVRQNTNRWTLVHEFMHHLFLVQAGESGYTDDGAQAEFLASVKALQDASTTQATVDAYARFSTAFDSRMVHYTLEEMTIEATLKEAKASGKLTYAPDDGNGYIESSAASAMKGYDSINKLGDTLKTLTALEKNPSELTRKIDAVQTSVNSRVSEIRSLSARYPVNRYSEYRGVLAAASEEHAGCAHDAETKKILEIAEAAGKINFDHLK